MESGQLHERQHRTNWRNVHDGIVATKNGLSYKGAQGYDADFFVVSGKLADSLGNKPFFRNITRLDSSLNNVFDEFGSFLQGQ